jgi:UTP:GlnB (protein PII) uridylyltransferase
MAGRIPKMSKQHFNLIAEAIAEAVNYLEGEANWVDESEKRLSRQIVWTVAYFVARKLSETNPRFSRVRFFKSCNLQ